MPATYELVDLHNHLLPGVDDGSAEPDESLRYLRQMADDGVARVAVSPHLNGYLVRERPEYDARLRCLAATFEELRAAVVARGEGLPRLEFSQELLLPDAEELIPSLFRDARVGIARTRYVLVEFGPELQAEPLRMLAALRRLGRRPVVAHPERYRRDGGATSITELHAWRAAGAILQVNAASLIGGYGPDEQRVAWSLVSSGLADLIGSDHHAGHGPVSLAAAARAVGGAGGGQQARLLAAVNPGRILEGREPLAVPPLPRRRAA